MHDGTEIVQGIIECLNLGDELAENIAKLGKDKAEAERQYRMAKRKRILYERGKGTPVSIIGDVVKGYQDIANLKFEVDCADALYEANIEAIRINNRRIDVYREQERIDRGARE